MIWQPTGRAPNSRRSALIVTVLVASAVLSRAAWADEGGLSFWLPGEYGSLAAVPGVPGWSVGAIYIHPDAKAGGKAVFPQGGQLRAGINGRGDLVPFGPTYVFEEPVLGA